MVYLCRPCWLWVMYGVLVHTMLTLG